MILCYNEFARKRARLLLVAAFVGLQSNLRIAGHLVHIVKPSLN
jgi:hypothetical protein